LHQREVTDRNQETKVILIFTLILRQFLCNNHPTPDSYGSSVLRCITGRTNQHYPLVQTGHLRGLHGIRIIKLIQRCIIYRSSHCKLEWKTDWFTVCKVAAITHYRPFCSYCICWPCWNMNPSQSGFTYLEVRWEKRLKWRHATTSVIEPVQPSAIREITTL
jgi:hypothetical protein